MSSDYPVQIDVTSPPHFDRVQLLLRIGIGILLGWLGLTAGWLVCLLFGALPLIAAVAISSERDGISRRWHHRSGQCSTGSCGCPRTCCCLSTGFRPTRRAVSSPRSATRGIPPLALRSRGSSP